MKYYVLYVDNSSPCVISFSKQEEAIEFLTEFWKKHGSLDDKSGNWIDHVFHGNEMSISTSFLLKLDKSQKHTFKKKV